MQATYLAHHGVKGMKWGVRKDDRYTSSSYSKRRNTAIEKTVSSMLTNQMAVRKAQSEGDSRGAARSWRKVNKDTQRYLKLTKDPAYNALMKQKRKGTVIGAALGGYPGAIIGNSVASNTKKGQALSAAYAKRYSEVQQHLSDHEKATTMKAGQAAVAQALVDMMKKQRPDIY